MKLREHPIHLGGDTVRLLCEDSSPESSGSDSRDLTFFNLHQNETTSVAAALRILREYPGRLFRFEAGGDRLISFQCNGASVRFDPNRVFSARGIETTLRKHNRHIPAAAVDALAGFRRELLRVLALSTRHRVVAVHNTGDDYSVLSYRPEEAEAASAKDLHIASDQHRHDFFIVTQLEDFERLRRWGYNVVLQSDAPKDDGSLSVLCGSRGWPYVNVEARYGALEQQTAMLRSVYALLG